MDINRAKQLFGDMGKLEMPSGNYIKEGTYQVLINKVEEALSRKKAQFIKATATVLVPISDGRGRKPKDPEYDGHYKGEEIGLAFFFGDRFNRDFSPFIVACMGLNAAEAKAMKEDDLMEVLAEVVRAEGQTDPGLFDGNVVIEMRGVRSNPVPDKKDPTKLKTFVNERYDKKVPLADIADKLDEEDMARYFGSFENFVALMEAESEVE